MMMTDTQDTNKADNKEIFKKETLIQNKTSNLLQSKKRGSSLKDLLNKVDQDHT